MVLILLARNPTDSLTYGLLPAAHRLGHTVRILTDDPQAHLATYAAHRQAGAPPLPQVDGCQVTDVRAVLAMIAAGAEPAALISNSDHLQTQTALAADYVGLPGKDWRSAIRARDKGLMRAKLRASNLDDTPYLRLAPDDPLDLLDTVTYPAVLKPAEGVASEDVVLVTDRGDLRQRVELLRARPADDRRSGDLLVEGLIDGPLHTLETLGDGQSLRVWGGYATTVSAAPYFIEERLTWQPDLTGESDPANSTSPTSPRSPRRPASPVVTAVLAQLAALGVGFGPCHTEYILTADGPRIVEVNDRLIGDHCDFAMADLLSEPVFEEVIEVFLGRPPRAAPAAPAIIRHGLVHSVLARRDGVLGAAPGRISDTIVVGNGGSDGGSDGDGTVQLDYWPLRAPGDTIRVTGTNRDYLGALRVIGTDPVGVEQVTGDFLATRRWVIE